MDDDRERTFRIRPPGGRRHVRNGSDGWSVAFKRMMHIVRMTHRRKTASGANARPSKPYMQRCAVRMTYSPNRTPGQWAAHGRYIARESATHSDPGKAGAFGPSGTASDIHTTLANWQKAGDPRMFKLIISPEFGERVDLERLTRQLLEKMEKDFGTRFEWVATAHTTPNIRMCMSPYAASPTRENSTFDIMRDHSRQQRRGRAHNPVFMPRGRRAIADGHSARRAC